MSNPHSRLGRQLPLRHLSIRVPWNDTDWTGRICQKPGANMSCTVLGNIRDNRDETAERELAGKSWEGLGENVLPPCVRERGGFMAPYPLSITVKHPYAATSPAHVHLLPTTVRFPAYSAPALPFSWFLLEQAQEKARSLELPLRSDLEEQIEAAMGFKSSWVQTGHNQMVMLDTFYSAIQPDRSLCIFYAKKTPLTEDPRRVIIGAGFVRGLGDIVPYARSGEGTDPIIWERPILHSIRDGFVDGFLLPYHQLLDYANAHPEENPEQFVAFAPADHFEAFSYASEHVNSDGAIAALLSCADALTRIDRVLPGDRSHIQAWIDARLAELWRMRGPCPGLGAALTAFGLDHGTLLAYDLERVVAADHPDGMVDPWPYVDRLFAADPALPETLRRVGPTLHRVWEGLPAERKALLKLLARFDLSPKQATRYFVHEDSARIKLGIDITDAQILANPYLLYESDRVAPDPIPLATIDRGLFPDATIATAFPLPEPSRLADATDPRRVRAYVVEALELAAAQGDTLLPRDRLVTQLRDRELRPGLPLTGDIMAVCGPDLLPVVQPVALADGAPALQLDRYVDFAALIRRTVEKRAGGRPLLTGIDWRARLDERFGPLPANDPDEERARNEKAAALAALAAARIGVLIGPAGTGKTTLLQALCDEPEVKAGGILLLAPTGKARVRMEQQIRSASGRTLAQFLLQQDRYDGETGRYHLSDRPASTSHKTVIVDEASMLTEDMLAALLDALKGVERLVLVGDPRQLPPIGAGRPFVDVVRRLQPEDIESRDPRVGPGYAELTVVRRNIGEDRDDLLLAGWFSGRPMEPAADAVWSGRSEDSKHLRFVRWDAPEALPGLLLQTLAEEIEGIESVGDELGFEMSLGGSDYQGNVFFWAGKSPGTAGAAARAEDWQILSPVRQQAHGVEALNKALHDTFRSKAMAFASRRQARKVPRPAGPEAIIYGDKVINLRNERRTDVWPKDSAQGYVANGEIGIVVGEYRGAKWKLSRGPEKLEIEFSSQPGYKYGFWAKQAFDEGDGARIELAYALTIHKAQGSEFGLTFVVVPNPCWLLSRELLYTALTRQRNRVILFHQGERHALLDFASDLRSATAGRLTNLFVAPQPVRVDDGRFLEDGLIHRTRRGDFVRSKSEVIIADLLHARGIHYAYEARLVGTEGDLRYPDFQIEDDDSGAHYYWEHLGLMHDPAYRRRWETKLAWYEANGIREHSLGGGDRGSLIITRDDERGGIDVPAIERVLDELML